MTTVTRSPSAGGVALQRGGQHRTWSYYLKKLLLYAIMIGLSVTFMVPMVWMVSTSLKLQGQVFAHPPIWIPKPIMWYNYVEVLQVAPLLRWLGNTTVVTVAATIGTIISASMVGFGFARLRFPGRGVLFGLLLATMMLPGIVTMIPTFIMFKSLDWLDTFLPLIVPSFFGGGAYNIFLVRQFYLTIPTDFDDAARIDGANNWTIWARIMLPLNAPVLTAVAIFSFVGHWNEFMGPLIYLFSEDKKTLALGLRAFVDPYLASYHLNMAGAMYLTLPMVIIFFFGQRYFLRGVVMTGITGR